MTQKIKPGPAWYRYDAAAVIRRMQSHESGLSAEEARRRLADIGPNRLPSRKSASAVRRWLACFSEALTCVLLVAAILTSITGRWLDTAAILVVVALNALIGWLQRSREAHLPDLLPRQALVRRGGEAYQVDVCELVPGDIIMLRAGDKVPADLRLIEAQDLRVDETILNGLTTTVAKQSEAIDGEEPVVGGNMLLCGTTLASGCATGILVATGKDTTLGKTERLLAAIPPRRTPLLRRLDNSGNRFFLLIVMLIVSLFGFSLLWHRLPINGLIQTLAGLAVAAAPAALPLVVVLTLALSARRLAKKKVAIHPLITAETLGAASVILCDKAGMLTMNEMTVKSLILFEETIRVEGNGYRPEGRFLQEKGYSVVEPAAHAQLSRLIENMDLCNDSALLKDEKANWGVTDEPVPGALKTLAAKARLPRQETQLLERLPFDAVRKYQATHHLINGVGHLLVTGEADTLLEMCDFQQTSQGLAPLDVDYWQQRIAQYAGEGLRLIASACRLADKHQVGLSHEDLQKGLVFCGIAAIIDPPRPEAIQAIADCHRAGIKLKIITDDCPETAQAMGRMLGTGDSHHVLTGSQLQSLADAELALAASRCDIFTRIDSQQKLRLVAALQSQGEVVAITGRGIKDAPALRQADIGIAAGAAAGNLTLADNSLATLVGSIDEGRRVRQILQKAVQFVLPVCLAQAMLFIFAMLTGKITPLMPLQALWLNMVTAAVLALSLAFEKADPPEPQLKDKWLFWHTCFAGMLITLSIFIVEDWLQARGYTSVFIHTVLLQTLVAVQWVYLLFCREPGRFSLNTGLLRSSGFWLATGILVLLQLAIVTLPAMQQLFGTTSLTLESGLLPLAVGVLLFMAFEIEKLLMHRLRPASVQ